MELKRQERRPHHDHQITQKRVAQRTDRRDRIKEQKTDMRHAYHHDQVEQNRIKKDQHEKLNSGKQTEDRQMTS